MVQTKPLKTQTKIQESQWVGPLESHCLRCHQAAVYCRSKLPFRADQATVFQTWCKKCGAHNPGIDPSNQGCT